MPVTCTYEENMHEMSYLAIKETLAIGLPLLSPHHSPSNDMYTYRLRVNRMCGKYCAGDEGKLPLKTRHAETDPRE